MTRTKMSKCSTKITTSINYWTHRTLHVNHDEVCLRRNVFVSQLFDLVRNNLLCLTIHASPIRYLVRVVEARNRGRQRHDVHAVPSQVRPHSLNGFRLSDAVTATQAGHSINFRESARDDQIGMILDQRND